MRSVKKPLLAATLALAAGLGAVGSAQGAIVTGKLDPVFGGVVSSPLGPLYFTGIETFSVANACLGFSGFVSASGSCGSAAPTMNFTGATINFYNVNPASNPGAALLGTATFPDDSTSFLNPILGMYVSGNQVVAVQSLVIGKANLNLGGVSYLLDIQFGRTDLTSGPSSQLGEYSGGTFTSISQLDPYPYTTLFIDPGAAGAGTNPCNISGLVSTCVASDPALTSFGVPEPATWTMMLSGFAGVGGLLRSRRKRNVTVA